MRREIRIEVPVFYGQNLETYWQTLEIKEWRIIERIIKGCKDDGFSTVDCRYDACGPWTTFRYQYPERVVRNPENINDTTLVGHEKGMKKDMNLWQT